MKIVFTQSRHPNLFSKIISWIDETPYTHCFLISDVRLPSGEPLVVHSQWAQGLSISPMLTILGSKKTKVMEVPLEFDWKYILFLMEVYSGATQYGFFQSFGFLVRLFGIKEPEWLKARYSKEMNCSEFILNYLQHFHFFSDLDLDRTGPKELLEAMEKSPIFKESTLN